MTSNTVNDKSRKDLENFQYWWNVLAFDVYWTIRTDNESEYAKSTEALKKFEARIKRDHPEIYPRLRRPDPTKHTL